MFVSIPKNVEKSLTIDLKIDKISIDANKYRLKALDELISNMYILMDIG